MAVSLPVMATLSALDEVDIVSGPCVLTDLILTELTGAAPAVVVVTGTEDEQSYMALSVLAGQSAVWHGRLVMGSGITLAAQSGEVAVTVGYY